MFYSYSRKNCIIHSFLGFNEGSGLGKYAGFSAEKIISDSRTYNSTKPWFTFQVFSVYSSIFRPLGKVSNSLDSAISHKKLCLYLELYKQSSWNREPWRSTQEREGLMLFFFVCGSDIFFALELFKITTFCDVHTLQIKIIWCQKNSNKELILAQALNIVI